MARLMLPVMLMCVAGGCNVMAFPAYVLFGDQGSKVKAEYEGLAGKHSAVMIAGHPAIEFEYPYAQTNLSLALAQKITENVKGATFAAAEDVERFRKESTFWVSAGMKEIGERFGAQRIVYIELLRYTMLEDDSVNLLRGRIEAEVRLYDLESAMPEKPCYRTEVSVVVPETYPLPTNPSSRRRVEEQALLAFTTQLAEKFYDHRRRRNK